MPRDEWEAAQVAASRVAIVSDFAAPLFCHADGRLHGSRSTYDAAVRQAGLVEVGRTEMRKLASGPAVRARPMPERVRDTLRRFANQ
jgi:hypothetical protein